MMEGGYAKGQSLSPTCLPGLVPFGYLVKRKNFLPASFISDSIVSSCLRSNIKASHSLESYLGKLS